MQARIPEKQINWLSTTCDVARNCKELLTGVPGTVLMGDCFCSVRGLIPGQPPEARLWGESTRELRTLGLLHQSKGLHAICCAISQLTARVHCLGVRRSCSLSWPAETLPWKFNNNPDCKLQPWYLFVLAGSARPSAASFLYPAGEWRGPSASLRNPPRDP